MLRTDVKSYYASIDHLLLLDQLAIHLKDRRVLNILAQYLRRTSERGGCLGLSERHFARLPIQPLDRSVLSPCAGPGRRQGRLVYTRFMDDILILAPTRWQLRRAVKAVDPTLGGAQSGEAP